MPSSSLSPGCRNCRTLSDTVGRCRTTVGQLSDNCRTDTLTYVSDNCRTLSDTVGQVLTGTTYAPCRTLSDTVGHCRTVGILSDCRTVGR